MALQDTTSNSMILVDKPFLSTDDAASLFSNLYGMDKPTYVKQLDGYDSQNFLVRMKDSQQINSGDWFDKGRSKYKVTNIRIA